MTLSPRSIAHLVLICRRPVALRRRVFGTFLATYTGVLLGATAIPAWFLHRILLPIHFGTAGLGSAAAILELLGFRDSAALRARNRLAAISKRCSGFGWNRQARRGRSRAARRWLRLADPRRSELSAARFRRSPPNESAFRWRRFVFLRRASQPLRLDRRRSRFRKRSGSGFCFAEMIIR